MRIVKDQIFTVESGKEMHYVEIFADSSESSDLPTGNIVDGSIAIYTDNGDVNLMNEKTDAWVKQFSLQGTT